MKKAALNDRFSKADKNGYGNQDQNDDEYLSDDPTEEEIVRLEEFKMWCGIDEIIQWLLKWVDWGEKEKHALVRWIGWCRWKETISNGWGKCDWDS